jgi:hypothetical protein
VQKGNLLFHSRTFLAVRKSPAVPTIHLFMMDCPSGLLNHVDVATVMQCSTGEKVPGHALSCQ